VVGIDNTLSNYSFISFDNLGNDLFNVRNDGMVWSSGGGNFITNTAYGQNALRLNNINGSNSAYGHLSLSANINGQGNSAFGDGTLISGSNITNCSAFGASALQSLTTSETNDAFGENALVFLTSGSGNYAAGAISLERLQTGSSNTSIGNSSGQWLNSNSSNNTIVGYNAANGAGAYLGNSNTILGANANAINQGSGNIVIGSGANQSITTSMNNTLWLDVGNNAIPILYGNLTTKQLALGTVTPATTAILDITSTTKGVALPRMSTTQKLAISSPAEGLIVYDLTLHIYQFFNGTIWINL
jgi:hypothetical protein